MADAYISTTLDFGWSIRIARDLLAGHDPYAVDSTASTVPYPLPVFVLGLLLLPFSFRLAGAVFSGVSIFLIVFGSLKNEEPWRLPMLLSFPFIMATVFVPQWSPLVFAAWFFPILAPYLVLVKPQNALPVGLVKWHWKGIAIAAGILILTLIIYPTWPWRWLAQTKSFQYLIPVLVLPLGPILLWCLRYWRTPTGRFFILVSILPLRAAYDLPLLWLVPQNKWQVWVLTILSWLPPLFFVEAALGAEPEWSVPFLFIPTLLIMIWNEDQALIKKIQNLRPT